MKKYGLIGYPLGHSFSKGYFTEKFRKENIRDCIYENFPIENISDFPLLLEQEPQLTGLNVTIPHKTGVIKYLNDISQEAREICAVNVVKIRRKGTEIHCYGFNSDVYGFTESLKPYLEKQHSAALVLGTGGSSKAVCFGLERMGINVTLVSRQRSEKAISYQDIDRNLLNKTLLIINTTPLGMHPDITNKPGIDYDQLTSRHVLFDLVYNPEITAFLAEGKKRGCVIVGGLKMLELQAEKAWQIWNDEEL